MMYEPLKDPDDGFNHVRVSVNAREAFIAANKDAIASFIASGDLIERHNLKNVTDKFFVRHLFDGLYFRTGIKMDHDQKFGSWLNEVPMNLADWIRIPTDTP